MTKYRHIQIKKTVGGDFYITLKGEKFYSESKEHLEQLIDKHYKTKERMNYLLNRRADEILARDA